MVGVQNLLVGLLVPVCGSYAAWKLMPAVARRRFAAGVSRIPGLPPALRRRVDAVLQRSTGGCGCDGCDRRPPPQAAAADGAQPIVLHRRPPTRPAG